MLPLRNEPHVVIAVSASLGWGGGGLIADSAPFSSFPAITLLYIGGSHTI